MNSAAPMHASELRLVHPPEVLMVVIVGAVLAGPLIIDALVLDHEPPPEPAPQNGALSGHKG